MLVEDKLDWTREWRLKGRREGEAALLTRLLARKFGPLDAEARRKMETADAEQLLTWGEHLLTATSLQEVFVEGGRP